MRNTKKTVVVIGSNSFSGGDFIDLLLQQDHYRVVGVSRSPEKSAVFLRYKRHAAPDYRFQRIDLNHDLDAFLQLLEEERPSYIVNFAAQSEVAPSWRHPEHWFQTNTVAITSLANRLKDCKYIERYVHISSPEVYGACEGTVYENAPLNPSTPYAASKAAGDLSLFTFFKNFSFPLVMVRATNVYGPGQQLFKIIPRSIINLRLGRKIELHGGGIAVKSYIHIRDVSRAEQMVMEHGQIGQIYHVSPDAGVAVRDVVCRICQLLGQDFAASTLPVAERLGQDKAYVIDSTRLRQAFGWHPEISLDEGLSQTVEWIAAHWDVIRTAEHDYIHKP